MKREIVWGTVTVLLCASMTTFGAGERLPMPPSAKVDVPSEPDSLVETNGEDSGSDEVVFRRLVFPGRVLDWMPLGEDRDVVVGFEGIYIIMKSGEIKWRYARPCPTCCYDGTYIWTVSRVWNSIRIIALDPNSDSKIELPAENELPAMKRICFAPVRPGQICIAGSTGQANSGWIANCTIDEQKRAHVDVLAEGIPLDEAAKTDAKGRLAKKNSRANKRLFNPQFMFPLTNPEGRSNTLITISMNAVLVDPDNRTFRAIGSVIPAHLFRHAITKHDGSLYWISRQSASPNHRRRIWKFGFPSFKGEAMSPDLPGHSQDVVHFLDDEVHVVGSQWLRGTSLAGPYRSLNAKIPGKPHCRCIFQSNVYGLVLHTPETEPPLSYAVEFTKGK